MSWCFHREAKCGHGVSVGRIKLLFSDQVKQVIAGQQGTALRYDSRHGEDAPRLARRMADEEGGGNQARKNEILRPRP